MGPLITPNPIHLGVFQYMQDTCSPEHMRIPVPGTWGSWTDNPPARRVRTPFGVDIDTLNMSRCPSLKDQTPQAGPEPVPCTLISE